MATIINASNSTGLTLTSDLSGTLALQSNGNTIATVQPAGFSYPGAALQVVQGTSTTGDSTNSTSYVATSLSASITPKFSTSKILVIVNSICTNTSGSVQSNYTVYRGATNIGGGAQTCLSQFYSSSGYQFVPLIMQVLDSPATTSSTTYTCYMKGNSSNTYFGTGNMLQTIVLMEIAA